MLFCFVSGNIPFFFPVFFFSRKVVFNPFFHLPFSGNFSKAAFHSKREKWNWIKSSFHFHFLLRCKVLLWICFDVAGLLQDLPQSVGVEKVLFFLSTKTFNKWISMNFFKLQLKSLSFLSRFQICCLLVVVWMNGTPWTTLCRDLVTEKSTLSWRFMFLGISYFASFFLIWNFHRFTIFEEGLFKDSFLVYYFW